MAKRKTAAEKTAAAAETAEKTAEAETATIWKVTVIAAVQNQHDGCRRVGPFTFSRRPTYLRDLPDLVAADRYLIKRQITEDQMRIEHGKITELDADEAED